MYRIKQKAADFREVFNTPAGKRVLIDLCKQHSVFQSAFNKDSRLHALKEGERNVVLRILTIMGYSEKQIIDLAQQEIIYNDLDD